MRKIILSSSLCLMVLAACAPTSMMREQRTGLGNALSEAAGKGHLNVSVFGAPSTDIAQNIVDVMEGYNDGPELVLKQAADTGRGIRMVVVLDAGFNVYGRNLCAGPDLIFDTDVAENSRVVFGICHSDVLYSSVSATYREGRLAPTGKEFEDFYRNSFRYVTDLKHDRLEGRSNCGGNRSTC